MPRAILRCSGVSAPVGKLLCMRCCIPRCWSSRGPICPISHSRRRYAPRHSYRVAQCFDRFATRPAFNGVIGLLVGGGILWLLAWASPYLFGKEGMGGGDIKLLAMIGAFLGWKPALLTIMLGSFFGSLVGWSYRRSSDQTRGLYSLRSLSRMRSCDGSVLWPVDP